MAAMLWSDSGMSAPGNAWNTWMSSGQTVSGLVVGSDTTLEVSGGTAIGTTIAGGQVDVENGGTIEDTLLVASGGETGFLYVSSGAVAVNTTLSGGGYMDVYGGTASGTTLLGTAYTHPSLDLVFGGTATSTTLGSGSDEIVFASGLDSGAVISSGGYLTVDSGGTAVSATVMSGGTLEVFFGGTALDTVSAGGVVNAIPCFAAGTLILTERGDVPVEHLAVGDLLPTEDGAVEPITWVGSRHVDCRRHPRPAEVLPVRISAHAFGPNAPSRDLYLSPDHALYAEGVLIPVKHLINGDTIRQIDAARVTYVHVELPRHAVILAEGLPCESYLDTGDRSGFANADGPVTLHPAFGAERCDISLVMEAAGYAPLRVTGPEVDKVRARLAARAASADAQQPRAVVAKPGRRHPPRRT